jgi:hypothetical protein
MNKGPVNLIIKFKTHIISHAKPGYVAVYIRIRPGHISWCYGGIMAFISSQNKFPVQICKLVN